ncbi:tRNA-splicing endonuclease subunit sen54 [Clarireedia jacksonii]
MADIDEDAPINSLHSQSNEDNEGDDETQDFRLLASLSSKTGQLPKRGEKDFEPHGTKQQDGILAASRQAMHDALDYTRIHHPKSYVRGFYLGEGGLERDDVVRSEMRQGLEEDHIVVVEAAKGPHYRTMGRSNSGYKKSKLWLLPEEALYLVERGNLDLWWPNKISCGRIFGDEDADEDVERIGEDDDEEDEGAPMSLQAAYAMLIGEDGERGKISLERYNVYANLKRNGYVVMRGPEWNPNIPSKPHSHELQAAPSKGIFTWIFELFAKDIKHAPYGPLVKPGLYRSYNTIYKQLSTIPRHKPSPFLEPNLSPPHHPFRISFHLWKPTSIPTFAKTNPGTPDFRVAVVDARATFVPTMEQMVALLESTPWDPPSGNLTGPSKLYPRLRHGYRNVVLAVNDQGGG